MAIVNNHFETKSPVSDYRFRVEDLNHATLWQQDSEIYTLKRNQTLIGYPRTDRAKPKGDLLMFVTEANTYRIQYANLVYKLKNKFRYSFDGWQNTSGTNSELIDMFNFDTEPDSVMREQVRNGISSKIRSFMAKDMMSFAETVGEYRETKAVLGAAASLLNAAHETALGRTLPMKNLAKDVVGLVSVPEKRTSKRPSRTTRAIQQLKSGTDSPRFMRYSALNHGSVPLAWVVGHLAVAPLIGMGLEIQRQFSGERNSIGRVKRTFTHTEQRELNDEEIAILSASYQKLAVVASGTIKFRRVCKLRFVGDFGRARFTVGNPLEWVWAGTRLSFVVDWFLHVDDFLRSFNAIPPDIQVFGSVTDIVEVNLSFKAQVSEIAEPTDTWYMTSDLENVQEGAIIKKVTSRRAFNAADDLPMGVGLRVDPNLSVGKGITALSLFALAKRSRFGF